MKGRSLLRITIICAVSIVISLPIFAQSQRLPTDTELQQLVKEFRSFATSNPEERRDRTQIQKVTSFTQAWSQIDPETAPFFGDWGHPIKRKSIYPSNIKGHVCIIDENDIEFSFSQGTISHGKIKTASNILIYQGNRLGVTFINNKNQPIIDRYGWPRPLKNPAELIPDIPYNNPNRDRIIQQFQNARCTSSLPNPR